VLLGSHCNLYSQSGWHQSAFACFSAYLEVCCLYFERGSASLTSNDTLFSNDFPYHNALEIVPYALHKDISEISCSVPQFPHVQMGGPRGLVYGLRECFKASIWVELMLFIWLFVTSSVLAISKARSKVRVLSYSKCFDCVRSDDEPNIRASMICSSGFVNWPSSISILILLTKEWTVSPGSSFVVRSLNLERRKLLFGDRYCSNRVKCTSGFFLSS
jgi:hypothetical protein